jgi:hypothetical protein
LIIATSNKDGSENLLFYVYNYEKAIFEKHDDLSSKISSYTFNAKDNIINLIANDINGDHELDLIITRKDDKGVITTEFFLFSPSQQKFLKSEFVINDSGVIAGDFNGDTR